MEFDLLEPVVGCLVVTMHGLRVLASIVVASMIGGAIKKAPAGREVGRQLRLARNSSTICIPAWPGRRG